MCINIFSFFSKKIFFMIGLKIFISYSYNHTKNLLNKFEYIKN